MNFENEIFFFFFHFFYQDFWEHIWDRPLYHESTYLSSVSQELSFRLSSVSLVFLTRSIFLKSSCHLIYFDCRASVACRLDESEELFSSLGVRWINSSDTIRNYFQFFGKSIVILLIFVSYIDVTYRISSFSNPIHSRDLRDSSPSFLVISNIFFVILRRLVLIPSCVFIMMSRVLWIFWILSQVVLVFLSCCLVNNLQELYSYVVLIFSSSSFAKTMTLIFFSEIWISYYKISLKPTWQVWSLNFGVWFLNQAFLSYRNWIFLSSINLHAIVSALCTSFDVLCRVVFMI